MSQPFDVIVVGGGMVGSCAALSLSRQGYRVALVESSAISDHVIASQTAYHSRVSAISPTSQQFLSQLGIWQTVDAKGVCYYEKMVIWHQPGNARVTFDSVELARQSLGAIVENQQIQQALHDACENEPTIEWFCPDQIDTLLENSEHQIRLRLQSKAELSASLLIAADGRGSPTRQLAGLDTIGGDYWQTAIVANVDTEYPHQHIAWQRFLNTSVLALLPLANGQSSIVWSCDNDFARQIMMADEAEFCRVLSQSFEYQLGDIRSVGPRQSFRLTWHACEQWLKQRTLLIGDAAHGVHPLAGQGVNLGFSDVELLTQSIRSGESIWNRKRLRCFERQRKSETALATHAFSALKFIYGVDNCPVNQLRDLGMRLLQASPVAKRTLVKRALRNMA